MTLEIIKDFDFYFYYINKEIIKLESKYKWHYSRTMIYFLYFDYRKSTKLRELREEIDEKKFILSTRYSKKKNYQMK